MSADNTFIHQAVLLEEAVAALQVEPDGVYVDATFGRGGHSMRILEQLSERGRLLAIDKDPQAIAVAQARFAGDSRFQIHHGSFAEMAAFVGSCGLTGQVNGILLDLGVSSPQLDDASRGFSFMRNGPLDMRMDSTQGISAAEWLAEAKESEIAKVLKVYGEERFGKRIARAILAVRDERPVTTTAQLAALISDAVPVKEKDKHPATRSFQAIRIFINGELEDLDICLSQAVDVLQCGGRLAVISFHSLEDRIVKRFMRRLVRGDEFPIGLPVTADQLKPTLKMARKAIRPSAEEVAANPRARSAVLRVAEKL